MIALHNKEQIKTFLQQNVYLHIYSLGDLDDFFWNYTTWYASRHNGTLNAVILIYFGQPLPVLLALSDEVEPLKALLQSARHLLPARFYTHLSPGVEQTLGDGFKVEPHGRFYKMALLDASKLNRVDTLGAERLSVDDVEAVKKLFAVSYPGNWFDPRMLETGQYFGLWRSGKLVSVAGVHVYSKAYGVAALGNITTHPTHRGCSLGTAVTARLCQSLAGEVEHIGLNVNVNNQAAIRLYKKLGIEIIASYNEFMVTAR